MKIALVVWITLCIQCSVVCELPAQSISASIPDEPDPNSTYIFYLHGGVVQDQGANAVSEYYGKYEYQEILETFLTRRCYVISEVRPKDTKEKEYARKLKNQLDSLLYLKVPPENIVVVGASLGAYIALETSILTKNPKMRFVLLGLCSDYGIKYFTPFQDKFYGQFLSIYERSDSKGTCAPVFSASSKNCNFKEIELNMGIDHAFLFKPYKEWVRPMMRWIKS